MPMGRSMYCRRGTSRRIFELDETVLYVALRTIDFRLSLKNVKSFRNRDGRHI